MNKIIYKKTNLFTAVGNNTIFVHTVSTKPKKDNTETLLKYKELFPTSYNDYLFLCGLYLKNGITQKLVGNSIWMGYPDSKQRVAFMFVSKKIGRWQDGQKIILKNTENAVKTLLNGLPETIEVHSGKINVDNFQVPWMATERVINQVLEKYPRHRWYVHDEEL